MITKSDIELICNYTENSKPSMSTGMIYYMEHTNEDNDSYKREVKRKNRDLAIDAILDNKVDEFNKNRYDISFGESVDEGYFGTVSIKVKSLNVSANKLISLDHLWSTILNKLDSLTQNTMVGNHNVPLGSPLIPFSNVTISNDPSLSDSDNLESNTRKILSKIMMLSNRIAIDGYITGPAKTIICGTSVFKYIVMNSSFISNKNGKSEGTIYGLNVIISREINSNKILVVRSSQKTETGLNVINNINDNTYFMIETPGTWDRCITWFEVI